MSDRTNAQRSGNGKALRSGWVRARVHTEFSCGQGRGTGVIQSISCSKAVVTQTNPPFIVGNEVRLRFSLREDSLPIEIRALVTEEVTPGFEVEFLGVTPRTRKLLRMAIGKALSHAEDGHLNQPSTSLGIGEKD